MLLRALLAHYSRHPIQAVFLAASVVMANALLVGTQLINAQARASYAEGERLLQSGPAGEVRSADRRYGVSERDYVVLRRQGFEFVAPLVRERLRTTAGEVIEVLGIDALAMPRPDSPPAAAAGEWGLAGFSFPPYELWASPARLQQLGWKEGEPVDLLGGARLPPVRAMPSQDLGHRLLMDIGALQAVTGRDGVLSAMVVFPAPETRLRALRAALPARLEFVAADDRPDPQQLTRSFHLNLAAMGLLAFVVGVFLTYNAIAFSYSDRAEALRKIRLAGVGRAELRRALLLELGLFLTVGALVGGWLGSWLAARLLPGVGQTLAQLYGVYIAYPDALSPGGLWPPLIMTLVAGLMCAAYPQQRLLSAPLLRRDSRRWDRREILLRDGLLLAGGLVLLGVSGVLAGRAASTLQALVGMASLLLGAALCLPMVMRVLLASLGRALPGDRPRVAWLLADSRWLLGPAAVALMAMTLALVANSGLNTMISSFRQATDEWLDQRLAAQLYLRADRPTASLSAWVGRADARASVVERHRTRVTREPPSGSPVPVEVVTLQRHPRFDGTVGLMRTDSDAQSRFDQGEGVFISERAWRVDGWSVGDYIDLCDTRTEPVLGVYHDYGNPVAQWMVPSSLFEACWPELGPASLAVVGPDDIDWPALRVALMDAFSLGEDEILSQAELRQVGMAVFDRTFRVTNALNALTLMVAGIGIFCAVSAIHHHRVAQQALLAVLGLDRRQRGGLLLLQWGLFGLLTMVLVWPFGTVLAGYLGGVVTPVAFGWSFPLRLDWGHYAALAGIATASLVAAVLLPTLRLVATSPASLLREDAL